MNSKYLSPSFFTFCNLNESSCCLLCCSAAGLRCNVCKGRRQKHRTHQSDRIDANKFMPIDGAAIFCVPEQKSDRILSICATTLYTDGLMTSEYDFLITLLPFTSIFEYLNCGVQLDSVKTFYSCCGNNGKSGRLEGWRGKGRMA